MRGSERIFKVGTIQHIYQNTVDGCLIFYSVRDYLVFFSLLSIAARKYNVKILGVCLMPDHVHILAIAERKQDLSQFVCYYTSRFVLLYNPTVNRKGQFFRHSFGSAVKTTDKKSRFAIAYLYNNLVEKQLADDVESGQWNFLQYAIRNAPFSAPIDSAKARRPMRKAMQLIRINREQDIPLNYALIERMTKPLTAMEKRQLTDYTIQQYNCIDYPEVIKYFGSYNAMVTAFNTTTGSEYDVREVHHKESDAIYQTITKYLLEQYPISNIKDIFFLEEGERKRIAVAVARKTRAPWFQIAKFFHLPPP